MRLVKMLTLSFLCLILCVGCGKKEDKEQEHVKSQSEETKNVKDAADSKTGKDTRTDSEIIADAMEATSKLASFQTVVEGSLKLGGKTINGEFGVDSEIHVVQGENRQNLQMIMETRLSPGDAVSKAYYKDGWYYADNGKDREKQEKSPEEVLGLVTDITDMVIDASDKIDNINVKKDGTDMLYSYDLPSYIAEDYIRKLMTEMGAEDTILEDASTEVESIELISTVNEEGILTRQEIFCSGKIKKAIVSVPVEAEIEAEFTQTDEKELQMELW